MNTKKKKKKKEDAYRLLQVPISSSPSYSAPPIQDTLMELQHMAYSHDLRNVVFSILIRKKK